MCLTFSRLHELELIRCWLLSWRSLSSFCSFSDLCLQHLMSSLYARSIPVIFHLKLSKFVARIQPWLCIIFRLLFRTAERICRLLCLFNRLVCRIKMICPSTILFGHSLSKCNFSPAKTQIAFIKLLIVSGPFGATTWPRLSFYHVSKLQIY